jgi:TetR/AcrR family fatty acid metabolism transcriptional regulator
MSIHSYLGCEEVAITARAGKNGDKYQRILEAAVGVFADRGFHQATISQIARAAGVADGTIYLYFKNKDDILVQFFGFTANRVFAGFRETVDGASDAVHKLRNLVHRHLSEFQRDREMAVVYQALTHQNNHLAQENMREISKMYMDIVGEIVERGQEEGTIRRDLYVGLVKRFILGAVDSTINNWLLSRREYDLTSMADPLVDLFFRGIGAPDTSGQTESVAGPDPAGSE